VAEPGQTLTDTAVIDWCRNRLAGYKSPRSVDIVDALPRNATGKVLKNAIRKPFWEGSARQVG
jgi:acyl-CoA synthetase (AMP-forming)/AMP-acid ligase II